MQKIIGLQAATIIITLIFGSVYVTLQQFGRRRDGVHNAALKEWTP